MEEVAMALTILPPAPLDHWVQSRVDSGASASAEEYVQQLIRRDQADADERDEIAVALAEAEASGESECNVLDILAAIEAERTGAAG
jgi:Arc/MetJ-type ribon-helix-helix transcriptional regulator